MPLCEGFTSLSRYIALSHCPSLSTSQNLLLHSFSVPQQTLETSESIQSSYYNSSNSLSFDSKFDFLEQFSPLQKLAINFCPYILVEIMKMLEKRQVAFAFFKFVFQDKLERVICQICIAAHLLAAEDLRYLAQDVLTWVIRRTGVDSSIEVAEFMWREHSKYVSDFLVLDSLMRTFTNAEMEAQAIDVLGRMRETGGGQVYQLLE